MRFFALSLLLLACGPVGPPKEPHCITGLGMRYMGEWETGEEIAPWHFTCEYFQETERRVIQALGSTYIEDANIDATRLMGVQIWMVDKPDWVDDWKRHIAGQSFCVYGYMHINNSTFAGWSSLPHEMMHFLQNCGAVQPPDPNRDSDHANWDRDGIYQAIDKAVLQE